MADHKNIIKFTDYWEGGLSSAQTDTARFNPAPCGNGKNGYPYHTNRGIQWITFKNLAYKLGYEASCSNFLKMPQSIWLKIYKYGYWDPMNGDEINNQAIANIFVKWAWGSGVSGATSSLKKFFQSKYNKNFSNISEIVNFVNEIDKKNQNKKLFDELMAWRKQFLINTGQKKNFEGWFNRENAFYLQNLPYLLSNNSRKAIKYGIITIILGTTVLYISQRYGK